MTYTDIEGFKSFKKLISTGKNFTKSGKKASKYGKKAGKYGKHGRGKLNRVKNYAKKHKKFTIFNIAGGKKVKIFEITNTIKNILQKKIKIKFLDKLKSPLLPELSNLKLIKKIGKIKFTSFEIGLLETLNWIKKSNKKNK